MSPTAERLRQARIAAGFDTARAAARRHGWSVDTYGSHENGTRGLRNAAALRYARAFKVSAGWLLTGEGAGPAPPDAADAPDATATPESDHGAAIDSFPLQPVSAVPTSQWPKDLQVLGLAVGGREGFFEFNGQIAEWTYRPPSLVGVPDAYALYVMGNSVAPRYREGEMIWVHPRRRLAIGDYVVVQLNPKREGDVPEALIGELARRSNEQLVIRKHQPQLELRFPLRHIRSVHLIVLGGPPP